MTHAHDDTPQLLASVRIRAALPDDGTERELLRHLRERGVTRVESVAVRAVATLQQAKTRRGKLPEPRAARLVTMLTTVEDADDLFEFVFRVARIDRPGGGVLMQDRVLGATVQALPAGVPDEPR